MKIKVELQSVQGSYIGAEQTFFCICRSEEKESRGYFSLTAVQSSFLHEHLLNAMIGASPVVLLTGDDARLALRGPIRITVTDEDRAMLLEEIRRMGLSTAHMEPGSMNVLEPGVLASQMEGAAPKPPAAESPRVRRAVDVAGHRPTGWALPGQEGAFTDLSELMADADAGFYEPVEVRPLLWGDPAWVVRVPCGDGEGMVEGEEHEPFTSKEEAEAYCKSAEEETARKVQHAAEDEALAHAEAMLPQDGPLTESAFRRIQAESTRQVVASVEAMTETLRTLALQMRAAGQ